MKIIRLLLLSCVLLLQTGGLFASVTGGFYTVISTQGQFTSFTSPYGQPSQVQSIQIDVTYYRSITFKVPAAFEISLDQTSFSDSIVFADNGQLQNGLHPIIYIRLKATAPVGNYSGRITANGLLLHVLGLFYQAGIPVTNLSGEVTKGKLLVVAEDKARETGTTNPALSLQYIGFVNGDDASVLDTPPLASTSADENSTQGIYIIAVAGGLDDRYEFEYSSGRLLVASAPVPTYKTAVIKTGSLNSSSFTYGNSPTISYALAAGSLTSPVTISSSELFSLSEDGTTFSDILTVLPNISTDSINKLIYVKFKDAPDAGTYTSSIIHQTLFGFHSAPISFTVNKAVISITADNKQKDYWTFGPAMTYTLSGFVNGDTRADIPPISTTLGSDASGVLTGPGNYPIGFYYTSFISSKNYSFSYIPGVFTVLAVDPSIIAITKPAININYVKDNNFVYGAEQKISFAISGERMLGTISITALCEGSVCSKLVQDYGIPQNTKYIYRPINSVGFTDIPATTVTAVIADTLEVGMYSSRFTVTTTYPLGFQKNDTITLNWIITEAPPVTPTDPTTPTPPPVVVTPDKTTAVLDQQSAANIKVYPNPISDIITVDSPYSINQLTLSDVNGKVISQSTSSSLSLGAIAPGVYILEVDTERGKLIRRVVR